MEGLVLSAVLPVLFEKLTSAELLKFATQEGVRSKLQKWEKTLKMIDGLLIDAEEKQLTSRAVKMWLDELQDLAYDVEDILDEYATEALRRKLKIEEHQASSSRARKLIPACCVGRSPTALWSDIFGMRSKVDGITSRLQDLCNQRSELNLVEIGGKRRIGSSRERVPSTSLQIEPVVYGRDEDKSTILDMVLSADASNSKYGVISIVGMGGLGKTTLAQSVYSDEAVKDFSPKGWVCVSDDFDILKISIAILESITGTAADSNMKNLDTVQNRIKEKVSGRKFLLVLDDVWSEDYNKWRILQSPLMEGASGSKIIVTTRNERVALTMGNPEGCHMLQGISDDDCWSLFKNHALGNQPLSSQYPAELVRQKVVEKCKGLPLAARTIGGLLRCKRRDEWLDILSSRTWELVDNSEIPAALHISYHHLPSHLKRCFAYCGILPKDYQFEEKELVLLWMAEGFIQQSDGNKQLEVLGGEYFKDLLARSIFQTSSSDVSKFTMHDLINDLAIKVSSNLCFRLGDEMSWKISEKARFSSYLCQEYSDKSKFEVLNDAKLLRSYLTVAPYDTNLFKIFVSNAAVSYLFSRFRKLKTLSLQGFSIVDVPDSIGDLRLLRYLNLSNTYIRRLPDSISSMCYMQTLLLRNCTNFLKWPSSVESLVHLRHLDFSGAHLIQEMPMGMKKLVCLQSLSKFVVGKDSGSSLEDLEDIKGLCGALHISRLENVTNFKQGRKILANKLSLKVLVLEWSTELDESIIEEEKSRNKELDESILDMLQPHQNLAELTIRGYGDKTFSSWVGDVSFCKMTILSLEDCIECRSLPSLGLLDSLKHLTIKGLKGLKNINSTFYGQHCSNPFRSLEILSFENLENLESWEPVEDNKSFPRLQELCISNCPKFSERLPKNLSSLKKLIIKSCEQLVVLLSNVPMLSELELEKCRKLSCAGSASLVSLKTLRLSTISDSGDLSRQLLVRVQNLKVESCNEVIELWQNEIVFKESHQVFQSLNSLSKLEFSNCYTLTTLPEFIKQKNVPLKELRIKSCNALSIIFRGHFPQSLKKLDVENCENLQHLLADYEDGNTSSSGGFHLEDMHISTCPSLTLLPPIDQLSATLTSLDIFNCSELRTLSLAGHLCLKHLRISFCSEFTTLAPKSRFPETLETLKIEECGKLESMVEMFHKNKALHSIEISNCKSLKSLPEGLEMLTNLKYMKISSCGDLASFPKGGFPDSNLSVKLTDCIKLEALPCGTHLLSSLVIVNCVKISHLPTKLEALVISNLNQYKAVVESGLHNCNSLRTLHISCLPSEESLSVSSMEMALPPNLNKLHISSLPMLKCLDFKDFESLSFLKQLEIYSCPELTSLPCILPSSLQHIWILSCPKLTSLPSILPSSLLSFKIVDCPSLKRVCERDRGKEWPKIADIPLVEIDSSFLG